MPFQSAIKTPDSLPLMDSAPGEGSYALVRSNGKTYRVPVGLLTSGSGLSLEEALTLFSPLSHTTDTANPHAVSKAQVGLGDVDNTSDAAQNSAIATLTNKTLTNPVINGFAGDTSAINIGSGQFVKDPSGNVGIGTATPTTTQGRSLHLYHDGSTGTVADNAAITVQSANRNAVLRLSGSATSTNSVSFLSGETAVAGIASNAADSSLQLRSGGTTTRVNIDSAGVTTFVSAAFGYGPGAGGAVTQPTSITTPVTINKPSMEIKLFRQAWYANEDRGFVINNSFVGVNDSISVTLKETGAGVGQFAVNALVKDVAGGFYLGLRNITGGSLPDTQVTVQANIIRGSAS